MYFFIKQFIGGSPYIFFCLLLFSCGLDTIIYLEPPTKTNSNYDSEQDVNKYLSFETSESKNASVQDYVKGFEIYYRIYERKEDRSSDYSAINKYDEDNPGTSATYLLESKKYKILFTNNAGANDRPLIKKSSSNREVKIRLEEFTEEEVGLYIDGTKKGLPIRYNAEEFKKDDISTSDEDVFPRPSGNTEEDEFWYVNMYAVTYGQDKTFKPLYSKLEFLGYLKVKKQ